MAIRTVVTRGYGNGTFNGTIALVVTRGYAIGTDATPAPIQLANATLDGTVAVSGTLDGFATLLLPNVATGPVLDGQASVSATIDGTPQV